MDSPNKRYRDKNQEPLNSHVDDAGTNITLLLHSATKNTTFHIY